MHYTESNEPKHLKWTREERILRLTDLISCPRSMITTEDRVVFHREPPLSAGRGDIYTRVFDVLAAVVSEMGKDPMRTICLKQQHR